MGPAYANELHVSLLQNQCLADILEGFDEIALPDAWLVPAASRRQSGTWLADNPQSWESRMST